MSSPENSPKSRELEPSPINFSLGITGEIHGAGSTTVSKLMAQILGFSYEYAGDYWRRLAVKTHCAKDYEDDAGLVRFNEQIAPKHPQADARLDNRMITRAYRGGSVFEGKAAVVLAKARLSPQRTPSGYQLKPINISLPIFTVHLNCDEQEAAKRILVRKRQKQQIKDGTTLTPQELLTFKKNLQQKVIKRQKKATRLRLKKARENWNNYYLYNNQNFESIEQNQGRFDLTIDTTYISPLEVCELILFKIRSRNLLSQSQFQEALSKLSQLINNG